jgi:predicted nucleotidyltransferase component of viral defense system
MYFGVLAQLARALAWHASLFTRQFAENQIFKGYTKVEKYFLKTPLKLNFGSL